MTLDEGEASTTSRCPASSRSSGRWKATPSRSRTWKEPTNPVEEILDSSKAGTSEKAAEQTAKEADATADAKGDAA
ncbi:MAG: hypothetical protein ACLT98_07550 [Eggerthellaceae bacterium]